MTNVDQKIVRAHSLTGRITIDLLRTAFRNVKRNRGAAGVDKVSIHLFELQLEQNLLALMRRLKTRGSFYPLPSRRVFISKGVGKTRPLGIPVVRDRVAQEVLRLLLNPIIEPHFHPHSFGYRTGKNCHQAVTKILEFRAQGFSWAFDADISGFFDGLSHEILLAELAKYVADRNILGIVKRFLKAGTIEEGVWKPTPKGTPQGGVISPLLANIVLNRLDWAYHNAGLKFVRYADDFVVLAKTEAQAQEAKTLTECILADLKLELSQEKTRVVKLSEGFDFLGFTISSRSVHIRDKAVEKFKTKVRELTPRHCNLDNEVITRLNQTLRGTAYYFGPKFSKVSSRFRTLDRWVRMRVRCMKYKRKDRCDNWRMKLKTFLKMGLLSMVAIRKAKV